MSNLTLDIPNQISEVINRLNAHTYNAYIVGKCVRELIVDKRAVDYDVITNAPIERICKIFEDYTVVKDNIKNGELMIAVLGMAILVASYKKGVTANGNPIYTEFIEEDLERRGFSFNAIAYNPKTGFIDPFGGVACLMGTEKVVSIIEESKAAAETEQNPDKNPAAALFQKKPALILQALGYYASGDYTISEFTKEKILEHKNQINEISHNDLRVELSWVISGKKISTVLDEYKDVFIELIPEFYPLVGFMQDRVEHAHDVYTHTIKSVGYASPILTLRYALLFHALGKPDCHSIDAGGRGHFYGHSERSRIYAERIMTRLGFTGDDIKEVCFLIKYHDLNIPIDRRSIKLLMREIVPERLKLLMQFKYADMRGKSDEFEGAALQFKRLVDVINEITAMKECYTVQQLAVNRYDLIQKGIVKTDDEAESMLERLLDIVLDSPSLNSRMRLIDIAEKAVKAKT